MSKEDLPFVVVLTSFVVALVALVYLVANSIESDRRKTPNVVATRGDVDELLAKLEAEHEYLVQEFEALKNLCGPLVITTYEREPTTITGPDGEVIK